MMSMTVLQRAQAGDEDAIAIINQANWYRSMRTRLRQEFGGLGDVFADILGATSAQTGVQQNYDNAHYRFCDGLPKASLTRRLPSKS